VADGNDEPKLKSVKRLGLKGIGKDLGDWLDKLTSGGKDDDKDHAPTTVKPPTPKSILSSKSIANKSSSFSAQ
jgi:hypothetical protein